MSAQTRVRRGHLILATLALIISALATLAATPPASAQPSWCRAWAFIGVPGSNQGVQHHPDDPWGPQIASIRSNFVTERGTDNVMKFPIDYPAVIGSWDNIQYGNSVAAGVAETKRVMTYVTETCPDAYIVLAGYSQGADVAGQVINTAGFGPRAKVYRVALIGHPRYNDTSPVSVPVGGSRADVGPGLLGAKSWDAYALTKVKDVCIEDDIVCDRFEIGGDTHSTYTSRLFPGAGAITITQWLGKYWLGNA